MHLLPLAVDPLEDVGRTCVLKETIVLKDTIVGGSHADNDIVPTDGDGLAKEIFPARVRGRELGLELSEGGDG